MTIDGKITKGRMRISVYETVFFTKEFISLVQYLIDVQQNTQQINNLHLDIINHYIVISLDLHDTDMEFVEEIFRFKQKLDALAVKEKI
jgi:hypothetical protein